MMLLIGDIAERKYLMIVFFNAAKAGIIINMKSTA